MLESILDQQISLEQEQKQAQELWSARQQAIGLAYLQLKSEHKKWRRRLGKDALPPFDENLCFTEDDSLPSMTVAEIEEGIS